jgi:NADPH:quinone reductase-like Zn-dependent oxidoreductase
MINPGLSCGTCEYCEMGEHSLCPNFSILGEHVPGTFAEYVAVPETNVLALPKASSYEEAAASSLVFLTAWRMLVTRGRIKPSETILIHGIGGGVSVACMQIALAAGLRAIVTSSSTDKVERAMGLGAHFGINYKLKDVAKEVRELTNGQGVDAVVDSVGEQTWGTSLKCLKRGGRLVTCGATTGGNPPADINRIFWNQISIIGSTMGSMSEFREFVRFMGIKKIRPIIHRFYSLEEGTTALEDLKNQRQFGKIVLNIG